MIALVWQMVRARPAGLAGSFVALALGAALLTATALAVASTVDAGAGRPRWFAHADVVITGSNTVTVPTGQSGRVTVRTAEARALPSGLASRLSTLDAVVTVDHAGYAAVEGAPGDTLHPWSAASLHGYAWESGGPPRQPGHLVLTAPTRHRPGEPLTVHTADGPRQFTVSGVLRTAAPPAFYAIDATAAELAGGRIDAIALTAPSRRGASTPVALAEQVRAVVGDEPVRVLTGDQRRDAEPDPDANLLLGSVILLGNAAGLAGFVSVFVVASTFAYAVVARSREFGLLRIAGATPRQVRCLVVGEALSVGILAAGTGVAAGSVIAPPFARWFAGVGFAPSDFTARFMLWPAAAAFGVGLLIALLGAWLPARRASRVRPAEVLREAAVDRRPMTLSRWLIGLGALAGAIPGFMVSAAADTGAAPGYFLLAVLGLICGAAALAPALVPPLIAVLTAPLTASPGATGLLARSNTLAAARRTAATAAPILITLGLAGAVLVGTATLTATEQAAARTRISAPAVVLGPVADATVAALRALPEVAAAVPVTDTTVYVGAANAPFDWTGRYVHGPDLSRALRIPVVAGDLTELTGTDTIAVPAGTWRLGETATLSLADATVARLRVVAVFADQIDLSRTVLLPAALRDAHTARPLTDTVYLEVTGADLDAVRTTAAAGGGTMLPTPDYLAAAEDQGDRLSRLSLIAILGLSLIYTSIAIANTMVMTTGGRTRDLAVLRLSGATTRQVLRMIGAESLLTTGVGILLAATVAATAILGLRFGLASRAPAVTVDVPWLPIGGIAAACLAITLLASLIPAAVLLRQRPVQLAGLRR